MKPELLGYWQQCRLRMVATAGQETSPRADIRRAVELRTLNGVGTLRRLQSQWKSKWREQKQNKNAMTNVYSLPLPWIRVGQLYQELLL